MEDRWARLEEIVRRVVREELSSLAPKGRNKIGFKNGFFTGIGDMEMAALVAAYPAVNVVEQIKSAAAWIVMNPTDAPRSNFGAFLNSWLRKNQNQASLRAIPSKPEAKEIRRRSCAYCSADAVGMVNSINHCRAHSNDAYEERPRRMLGVVPKPVAGTE